jgi:hypothetical protein
VDTETNLANPLKLYRMQRDHETYGCEHFLTTQTGIGARHRFSLDGRTVDALLCLACNQELPMPVQIVYAEPTTS